MFGELDGRVSARGETIRDVCQAAGIGAELSDDILRARWEKFIVLVAASNICAAARLAYRTASRGPRYRADVRGSHARGRGCRRGLRRAIPVQCPRSVARVLRGVPPDWTPSMAVDILAGRRLELPWLGGRLVELAAERGVPAPVNRVIERRC